MIVDLDVLLHAAVAGVGGQERPGQVRMAHAVQRAVDTGEHLLVQAGTGTGKSLAYLVPSVRHAFEHRKPVVVATATIALQAQIVDRDLPRLAGALAPLLGRKPTFALVKGRRNYVCLHKLEGGFPDDADALFGAEAAVGTSRLGQEVVRVRRWAQDSDTGDRDRLVPGVSEQAWRQVSVSAQECLGGKCPMVEECFVERARAQAQHVDVVVTNHSFMAIDAFEGRQMLPEHDLLVIDEAHELVDRVTSTITDELTAATVTAAARRAAKFADDIGPLEDGAALLEAAFADAREGRLTHGIPDAISLAVTTIRDVTRALTGELKPDNPGDADGARQVARVAVEELHETTARILEGRELDVLWLSDEPRRGKVLRVAPMSVAMLVRDKIFHERTVVLTSATIELGGTFDAVAGTIGLRGDGAPAWQADDVGSPFDYGRQAIAYVAAHLPPPGRDGTASGTIDEIEALVRAAGGRTLGLFSSMRAAQAAAEELRGRFEADGTDIEILCQGEDQITTLVRNFARSARTCLFGTLTLWQGVDVPGSSCQLVVIDRIPFPRPDDPLASARTEAIAKMGGNGFMAVSATHAALRLAQGSGRLIRRADDRGVVAFLDSRMRTARYAGFLQRSLPPFWPTTDRDLVLGALARLDVSAPEVLPVDEPGLRALAEDTGGPVAPPPPAPPSARTSVTAGVAWTADMDEELREAIAADVPDEDIAEHFGHPVEAVLARVRQLELTRPDLRLDL